MRTTIPSFVFAVPVLSVLLCSAPAAAQQRHDVLPGDWVRARDRQHARTTQGPVIRLDEQALVLGPRGASRDTVVIPRAQLGQLDVSVGRHRNTLRGMGIGFLALGLPLGMLSYASYEPCTGWICIGPSSEGEAFIWGLVGGGAVGLVVGGIAGALTTTHSWEPVDLPVMLRVEPGPGGGTGLVFRLQH